MRQALLLLLIAGGRAAAQAPAGAPDSTVLGTFEDDYGNRFSVSPTAWRQLPRTVYRIERWNAAGHYLIAQNGQENGADRGLWTRIDWMPFSGMAPYEWGFCLSAYKAASAAEAEATQAANRSAPKTGCNGYPFSRMRRVTPAGVPVQLRAAIHSSRKNAPPLVTLTVVNGLEIPVTYLTMSLLPNSWNGEAFGAGPVDIYRDAEPRGLFVRGPGVAPPRQVQGPSAHRIAPGDSLSVVLDLAKWTVVGGWRPGSYRVILEVRHLAAEDNRVQFSVLSDTLRFAVQP